MSSSKPKKMKPIETPEDPAPAPEPIMGREEDEAKKKVKKRRQGRGRASNILAGRLNAQRNDTDILKTRLG